jgi:cobaltochelatase CobN
MQQAQYLVFPCACCRYKYVAAPSRRALCHERQGKEYLQELGRRIMPSTTFSIETKRVLVAQVALCRGCCCGAVEKGNPEVPVEWMKDEWKKRGLKRSIQLTVSGCLGPCDVSNVITISDASGSIWLGNIEHMHQYQALVDWASQSKTAGILLPVPEELATSRFDPFRPSGS